MPRTSTAKAPASPEAEASSDEMEDTHPVPAETQFSPHESDDPDNFFEVECILDEDEEGGRYLLKWKGIDPNTKKPWRPSWEPKSNCTPELIKEWKRKKRRKEASEESKKEQGDGDYRKNGRSSSTRALRSSSTGKSASTRTTGASEARRTRSSMHIASVDIPLQRLNKHIPSKVTSDESDDHASSRAVKRPRKSLPEPEDAGNESEELAPPRLSKPNSTSSARNGNIPEKSKESRRRGTSSKGAEEPIELSSGSERDGVPYDETNDDDDDEDLLPLSSKPTRQRKPSGVQMINAQPVKVGPPRGKMKKKAPSSPTVQLRSDPDDAENAAGAARRATTAKKRERPSVLSDVSERDSKKRKTEVDVQSEYRTTKNRITKNAARPEVEVLPDSQPESAKYTTTQTTPSKSQDHSADTTRPLRSLVHHRDQMTPSKFIRKKGVLDSSDGEVEVPQLSTQIESFSSPSQPKKSSRPQPLNMRSIEPESIKPTSTSSLSAAAADPGWGAVGWSGEAEQPDNGDTNDDLGGTTDDLHLDAPAVGSGQALDSTSNEVSEGAAAGTGNDDADAVDAEMDELETVDVVLDGEKEVVVHTEILADEDLPGSKVEIVEKVEVLVPGTAPEGEETTDLVLPAFEENAPEVQAALELVKHREQELEVLRAEKQAEITRREAVQRMYEELLKERDTYKERADFLTRELLETPVPVVDAQVSLTGAERVTAAYAAAGAPVSQEELDAMFSGSNTNSTQEELATLRNQLDAIAAQRDELKASLALVEGTEASLRAELGKQTSEVQRLTEQVALLTRRAEDNDSELALLREVYAAASASASESKREADELRQKNTILQGQVTVGIAGAREFAQARVAALKDEVAEWKAMAELQRKRADRTDLQEIRERAAKEPMLQKRIRDLQTQVQELEEENADLDKQVKAARVERLLGRPMEEEKKRREAIETGLNAGLDGFDPDELVYRCEWWETLHGRCRAVYRTKGELWDHILSSDHIGMNS